MLDTAHATATETATAGESTELVTLPPGDALAYFLTEKAIEPFLAKVRTAIDAFVPDMTTPGGRKAIASMAYQVSRAKAYLEAAGKKLADEQKAIPKKVDATRRHINETLDGWRDEVRKPLNEWEAAETARVAGHQAAIFRLSSLANHDGATADELRRRLAAVEAVIIGEGCEEFVSEYELAKGRAVAVLREATARRDKYEAEQAELAKLRAEAAARQQADRDAALQREAAERATREAAVAAEAERARLEAAARAEREAGERRERDLKAAAERAEQERIAAVQRLERVAQEAIERAQREAAEKAAREKAEAEKREANKRHRAKINLAATEALVAGGINSTIAQAVVELIAQRRVPAVSIAY